MRLLVNIIKIINNRKCTRLLSNFAIIIIYGKVGAYPADDLGKGLMVSQNITINSHAIYNVQLSDEAHFKPI